MKTDHVHWRYNNDDDDTEAYIAAFNSFILYCLVLLLVYWRGDQDTHTHKNYQKEFYTQMYRFWCLIEAKKTSDKNIVVAVRRNYLNCKSFTMYTFVINT